MKRRSLIVFLGLFLVISLLTGCGGSNPPVSPTVATVTTIAGAAGVQGSADGDGLSWARFFQPGAIAVDNSGNIYVADTFNSTIRKLTKSGAVYTVSTIAGAAGITGTSNEPARFNHPNGIAVDTSGNIYVADTNNSSIRKLTWDGSAYTASTIASSLNYPTGIAVDVSGDLYVADTNSATIRKLTKSGATYTAAIIAGTSDSIGTDDGDGLTQAKFSYPYGIAVDGGGNVYVTDANQHTIRKLSWTGSAYTVTTIAGTAGSLGSDDGTGAAARFCTSRGITANSSGSILYVADTNNQIIRKLTWNGTAYAVTTIAGKVNNSGSTDGIGTAARFNGPNGIAIDSGGSLFVVDFVGYTIRMITF